MNIGPQARDEINVEESHKEKELEFYEDHPEELIIGSPLKGLLTRLKAMEMDSHSAFLSNIKPKNFQHAEKEDSWMMAMQENLDQFERNKVWSLVPTLKTTQIISTKWISRAN